MTIHELKTEPGYLNDIRKGYKTFEVRKFDRDFKPNDILVLRPFWDNEYKDQLGTVIVLVTYMLADPRFVLDGFVIMGIKVLHDTSLR